MDILRFLKLSVNIQILHSPFALFFQTQKNYPKEGKTVAHISHWNSTEGSQLNNNKSIPKLSHRTFQGISILGKKKKKKNNPPKSPTATSLRAQVSRHRFMLRC